MLLSFLFSAEGAEEKTRRGVPEGHNRILSVLSANFSAHSAFNFPNWLKTNFVTNVLFNQL